MSVTFATCEAFVAANSLSSISLSEAEQLQAYALFKQAMKGPVKAQSNISQVKHSVRSLNLVRRARLNAWFALGDMPSQSAKEHYVALIWSRNKSHFVEIDSDTIDKLMKNVSSSR